MEMARASSGLAYPERFYAAASYAGFVGSPDSAAKGVSSKYKTDVALLLYGLHQQATIGPCNVPKPRGWSPVEQSKWQSWNGLGNMASTEAMRLFVKILEEEDPGWYSRVSDIFPEPVDVQMNHNSEVTTVKENGSASPVTKSISAENGTLMETQDKDVVSEGFGSIGVYDQWVPPQVYGQRPKPRYEHGAAIIEDKMYVYGGNQNGRYLSDLQALDLTTWTWSKVEVKAAPESQDSSIPVRCAGHTLITWENKLLSVAGHLKNPSEALQVRAFDIQTCTWSVLKTYGKPPVARGGQSVTLVGNSLVIFGGQTANRTLLNDLHILDLETMTWDEMETLGVGPSPRSDHAAAVHAEHYLLIFGGGSHATCFNDLYILDLQTMEWSTPAQQGDIPDPRAGHAGVTVGENWFIVGGGDNNSGAPETVVLNMSTLVWSVVTSVQGRFPVASEGLSLVISSYSGQDILVSFGGYNGRYNNEIHVLKLSHKSTPQSKMMDTALDSVTAVHNRTALTRDVGSELDGGQDGKIREIVVDNVNAEEIKGEESSELVIASLKSEKEELESALSREKLQSQQLKLELCEAESRNLDLHKELQSVRAQLAAEQSRCFKLEVDVAELRQKLQTMDTMQKELELLQRQKATSEEAALSAKQKQNSGGVWGWLAGAPSESEDS